MAPAEIGGRFFLAPFRLPVSRARATSEAPDSCPTTNATPQAIEPMPGTGCNLIYGMHSCHATRAPAT